MTDNHPFMSQNTPRDRIEVLIRGLQAISDLEYARHFSILPSPKLGCDFKGRKYQRIWSDNGTQTMVVCFVDADENVLKAETYYKPAKGVRYNISTPEGLAKAFDARIERGGSWLYR